MTENQTPNSTVNDQTQADGYYDDADLSLDDENLDLGFLDEEDDQALN